MNLSVGLKNYVLTLNKLNYFITIQNTSQKTYLKSTRDEKIGTLITNSFFTVTGGTVFYKPQNDKEIPFYTKISNGDEENNYFNELKQKIERAAEQF